MAHHFRAGTPNCFGFKGSRRRCVMAQGLLDPMSGGISRNLSGTAGVY